MNINGSAYAYIKEGCNDAQQRKIVYFGRKISAGELFDTVERVGGYLSARGYGEGSVAGIMLPNVPEAVFALYGANCAGLVANLINPRLPVLAVKELLARTETKIIFIYDKLYPLHRETLTELGIEVVLCSVFAYAGGLKRLLYRCSAPRGTKYFEELLGEDRATPRVTDGGETAVYIHSGGTTGEPKTVCLSSRALNALADAIIKSVHPLGDFSPKTDSLLMVLPIFHGFGLGVCVHTILSVIPLIMLPRFNAFQANRLIKKYSITHLAGVPSMFRKMLESRNFEGKHLACIREIFCGGDKLNAELKEKFDSVIAQYGGKAEILEGYGLSETASVVCVGANGQTRKNSQGKQLVGNLAKIVGKKGEVLSPNCPGEIHLSPVSLMNGYLGDDALTARVLYEEGGRRWLKTGDLGYLDADGYIYFREREKRSIKIAATNIFPGEIEAVVNDIEWVKECCAARVKDAKGKPCVKLYVVLEEGIKWSSTKESEIKSKIAKKIMKYAVPRSIVTADSLGHTPLGKVDYKRYEQIK